MDDAVLIRIGTLCTKIMMEGGAIHARGQVCASTLPFVDVMAQRAVNRGTSSYEVMLRRLCVRIADLLSSDVWLAQGASLREQCMVGSSVRPEQGTLREVMRAILRVYRATGAGAQLAQSVSSPGRACHGLRALLSAV